MTSANLAQPDTEASLWAKLSPRAREFLSRQGHDAPAATPPPAGDAAGDVSRKARRLAQRVERQSPPGELGTTKRTGSRRRDRLRRQQRARERDSAYLDRLRRRMRAAGLELGQPPRLISRAVWAMGAEVIADSSGKAARVWLRRCRNKTAAGAIRLAALVPSSAGARYTWEGTDPGAVRARRCAALGLALVALSAPCRRKGLWSGGIVRGVTRGALCALLRDPWSGLRPSLTALAGRHRPHGSLEDGQVGYLRALELAGLVYSQQLPAAEVQPFERWGEWSSNRYWLVSAIPTAPLSDEEKRRLLALHEAGWSAPAEELELAPGRAPGRMVGSVFARAGPDPPADA